jgi:hypothetical protein
MSWLRRWVATLRAGYTVKKHFGHLRRFRISEVETALRAKGLSEKSTCVLVSAIFGGIGVVSKSEFAMAFDEIGKLKV